MTEANFKMKLPPIDVELTALRDGYALYHQENSFRVGLLIQLKAGLRLYRMKGARFATVIEKLETPAFDTNPQAPIELQQLPHDMWIGMRQSDGSFAIQLVCSRFWEPAPAAVQALAEAMDGRR